MSESVLQPSTFDTPIAMIAAMSSNHVIGVGNRLPWYLPEDLKRFKAMTQGKPLVMGRKTFESIGRPLPGRLNIVITRDESYRREGIRVCHALDEALSLADSQALIDGADEVMVMGGGEIYRLAMPFACRLYLTEVATEVEGDAFFPDLMPGEWDEVSRMPGVPDIGQPDYAFVEYRRLPSSG
ncbi:dihydrofolate reductase [Salinicola rhizosphaerae]|uniref:Dihydrofolate reductase n=1 Tax=Salinicola rhizosphaerae TaxID=1443141 RepID=A0ABQ3E3A9_9GAMM|nr:dihydrofolate reductase [Salinicola rhizosphaerae]GHB24963.1 dihydrofolate reductase [Salinicola rhizosphaerae]